MREEQCDEVEFLEARAVSGVTTMRFVSLRHTLVTIALINIL